MQIIGINFNTKLQSSQRAKNYLRTLEALPPTGAYPEEDDDEACGDTFSLVVVSPLLVDFVEEGDDLGLIGRGANTNSFTFSQRSWKAIVASSSLQKGKLSGIGKQ